MTPNEKQATRDAIIEVRMEQAKLDELSRQIVRMRLGSGGRDPLQPHQIAEELALPIGVARQLTQKALSRLHQSYLPKGQ